MIDASTLQFITEHLEDDVRTLSLQGSKYKHIDFKQALVQIAGRQKIKDKLPSWYSRFDLLLPLQLPLEQCSSEATARYKASLAKGDTLIDLTGGWGVDCAFMAPNFTKVLYFEQQQSLCEIAKYNFRQLGLTHIETQAKESTKQIASFPTASCIYIDPSRRDTHGKKTVLLRDCTPNIADIAPALLEKTEGLLVKLSPMLDISQAIKELPQTTEVHIVSVDNECKELLFMLRPKAVIERKIHCVNLKKNGTTEVFAYNESEENSANSHYTEKVENYIYEPNVSILKAGAFKITGERYGLNKLHPNSHLYTSSNLYEDFQGRIFYCERVLSPTKTHLKTFLPKGKKANITVRNFPMSVAELRKKTQLIDGGERYIFATTLANEQHVLILCRKLSL
jgi:hypothetical protein